MFWFFWTFGFSFFFLFCFALLCCRLSANVLIILVHSFIYEAIKSRLEVLCSWVLLWNNWVSHFFALSSIIINIFFPLGLLSFSRGTFSTLLPARSVPRYQVSCHLKTNNFEKLFFPSSLLYWGLWLLSPWTTFWKNSFYSSHFMVEWLKILWLRACLEWDHQILFNAVF